MITTSDTVTVTKKLRYGVPTSYTPNVVSLFIKHDGEQKRFTANSVVNATDTSSGLVTFSNIALWGDGSYSLYVTAESNTDLDVDGVGLIKLGTGYIRKITDTTTLEM